MDKFIINGGNRIYGSVKIDRAKNSLLPVICAAAAVEGGCFIEDFPTYGDTETMLGIVSALGGKVKKENGGVAIDASDIKTGIFPRELFGKIRASVFMLGAVLARLGYAETALPGGCRIGARPIDIHLSALEKMGAEIRVEGDRLVCRCERLKGAKIDFRYPSVGATENIMIAASLADGITEINNAAREPEIKDLAGFLSACGAKIYGAGEKTIGIEGVKRLKGASYKPIADRIEGGTFYLATVILGGEAEICGVSAQNISSIINKTENSACKIYSFNDKIYLKCKGANKNLGLIRTGPYPQFPTDLQAQTAAYMSVADGVGYLEETVFPSRFGYVPQLLKLGAKIRVDGARARIEGVKDLYGAEVTAEDLRGGAGLTLACLRALGRSVLRGVEHIDRGYDKFEKKLSALGLDIERVKED
ncbi:MAG: UDP-N-acetylglucosamine 1-carboxyvinyltransferase [Clostridia bacterium]|nr:UDP-N-acetylglucosamine 1-carboxyvinyltransferase [Clostridia bacterium]